MKNLLTTLMVLMIAMSAATAGAGDMDWKFYGKLHTSIDYLNDGTEKGLFMSSNTSRFGFKGAKELNENFTAIWQFESAINMAQKEGFTGLANRNTYLGLKGKFGQFRYGIHDTPFKVLGRKVELFKDELGDHRHATMGWDRRLQDIIAWMSPDWSGFGIFAGYQLDQSDDLWDKSMTAYSILAHYGKNEFFIGAALEGLSETYSESYYDATAEEDVYGDAPSGMRFAGKYDGEKFVVTLMYQMLKNWEGEWDFGGANPEWMGYDSNTFGVGALFRADEQWNIKAQYYVANPYTDAEDDPATDGFDEGKVNGSFLAIGVDYIVTKNVKFYLQYAGVSNGDNAGFGVGGTDIGGDRYFANGHGRWIHADYNDDGTPKNPSGFSLGSVISF